MMSRSILTVLSLLVVALGCERSVAPPAVPPSPRTDVPLVVLVVEQPEIARAIGRLRGDWAELAGGSLAVEESSTEVFAASDVIEADIVIYPSRYLAALVEGQRIRPLRRSIREDQEVAFHEILPAIRDAELVYGGEHYAVPFGSQLLAIASVGQEAESSSGTARSDRDAAAPFQHPAEGLPNGLPEGPFAAAWALLAQAAPHAWHPSQVAILFDPESMRPRISSPPFVRALEDLTTAASGGEAPSAGSSLQWVWWPPLRSASGESAHVSPEAVRLPYSSQIYHPDAQIWEEAAGGVSRVPLIGARSTVGSVTSSSRNAPAAFRLLAWLTSRSAHSGGRVPVVPFRSGASGELLETALSQTAVLQVPQLLEVDAYLEAVDQSVRRARQGELSPVEALQQAARKWEEVTDRVGRDRQRAVYRKHLNLE